MQLTWQRNKHPHHIIAADERGIRIGAHWHTGSLLVNASELITDWPVGHSNQLSLDSLEPVLCNLPEVLLLGTGERQIFPDITLLQSLFQQGIGVEIMHTLAACRTFNVLLSEQRKVTAALIRTR